MPLRSFFQRHLYISNIYSKSWSRFKHKTKSSCWRLQYLFYFLDRSWIWYPSLNGSSLCCQQPALFAYYHSCCCSLFTTFGSNERPRCHIRFYGASHFYQCFTAVPSLHWTMGLLLRPLHGWSNLCHPPIFQGFLCGWPCKCCDNCLHTTTVREHYETGNNYQYPVLALQLILQSLYGR